MLPSPAEITYFLEVSNTLNLSRAAERLGISQPSLSNAIIRLETTLGTPLLIRHKRGVTLTQAGKQFFNHARELMQKWEDLKSKALKSNQQIQGHFTLGCHPSVAKYSLPYFLPNLIKNYPNLEIRLKHDISRRITEEVISLAIDVAIVVNPVKHPDLIIFKLFRDKVTLWCNENSIQSVRNVPLIFDPELPQPQRILQELKKKNAQYGRILTSNNLDVIAMLTANGCGIGVLPERIVMSTYPTQLKRIAKAPVCHDDICLIYRHENRNVMAIQKIILEIKKLCNKSVAI
ncbi:MAG: LysR family transcriptional regulator [Gammaproteobacteria bacterium]|nr:LysR family transcriptional regulator [Gammaproteobacteria bacterium]